MNMLPLLLLTIAISLPTGAIHAQTAPTSPPSKTSEPPDELHVLQTRYRTLLRENPTPDAPELASLRADVVAFNSRNPYLVDSMILEAKINSKMDNFERADTLYRKALTAEPGRIMDGLEWAAMVHVEDPQRAIDTLRELSGLAPDRIGYSMGLYEYLFKFSPEEIDVEFDRMMSEDTASPHLLTLIDIIGNLDLDRGVIMGRQLHERFPNDLEATLFYARRLRSANLYEEARILLGALPKEQRLRPDIGVMYSDCLYMDHNFRKSIEHLLKFEGNTDDEYQAYNRERDWRLNTRPKMMEYWSTEQDIRSAQSGVNPRVRMYIDGTPIVLELYAVNAPVTVANFMALARTGFYDGTPFHNIQAGFISQGGVPAGETFPSYAGPGYSITDETDRADARLHFSGTISMAKVSADKAVGSQFYITHVPAHHLNGTNPVFGHVEEGLDVVRAMRGGEQIDRMEVIRPGTTELDEEFQVLTPEGETLTFSQWLSRRNTPAGE